MVREHAGRLNRTSLSSIHSQQSTTTQYETIPAELARQHAHTAAMRAYLRSQYNQPSDVNMSRRQENIPLATVANTVPNLAPTQGKGLRRQQSVRFVGINGLEHRESLTTRATNVAVETQQRAPLEPVAMTTNAPVPAMYRPPSRSSSIGKTSVRGHPPPSRSSSIGKTSIKAHVDSSLTTHRSSIEDSFNSTPSSYRRLRRSKSMFSPSKAPSIFYTNGTPKVEPSKTHKHFRSQSHTLTSQPSQRALRGFKSTSLLYDRHQQDDSIERRETEIQQARDRFFQEEQKQRLQSRPSFLFRSKKEQQDKPFRKSVRTQDSPELGSPTSDGSSNEQSKRQALKTAARKASKSIKTTFRRVFGRSKDEPMAIPNQQVEARETHVRHYNGDPTPAPEAFEGFSDIPHPDASTLSRVASRVPSIRIATPNQQLPTSQAPSLHTATPIHQLPASLEASIHIATPNHQPPAPQVPFNHTATPLHQSPASLEAVVHTTTPDHQSSAPQVLSVPTTTPSHQSRLLAKNSRTPSTEARIAMFRKTLADAVQSQNALKEVWQEQQHQREQQRLSVINENGTHKPSSSYGRSDTKYLNQTSAYPQIPFALLPKYDGSGSPSSLEDAIKVEELSLSHLKHMHTTPSRKCSRETQRSTSRVSSGAEIRNFFERWEEAKLKNTILEERKCSNGSKRSVSSGSNTTFAEMQFIFFGKQKQKKNDERLKTAGKSGRDDVKPNKLVRRGSSNSMASSRGNRTPATIRRVPQSPSSHGQTSYSSPYQRSGPSSSPASKRNLFRPKALKQITNQPAGQKYDPASDDVFSPKEYVFCPKEKTMIIKKNVPLTQPETRNCSGYSTDSLKRAYDRNTQAYLDIPNPVGMSPQKMANRNEGFVPEPKVLRESRSTFFGGSSVRATRKLSPYRRAMAELNKSNSSSITSLSIIGQPISNPIYQAGNSSLDWLQDPEYRNKGLEILYDPRYAHGNWSGSWVSESVYSRTTSGRTPPPVEAKGPELSLHPTAPKTAAINNLAVYTPTSPTGQQATSSASSQDWKKSISYEVARIERTKENNTTPTFVNYALPTLPRSLPRAYGRHVREKAQINDDDVLITQDTILTHQPLGIVRQKSPNVPAVPLRSILKKPSFDFSMLTPPIPELPPPIPPKSPLRKLSKTTLDIVLKARRKRISSEDEEANVGVIARGGDEMIVRAIQNVRVVPNIPVAANSWIWKVVEFVYWWF
jgi:hypothetical protein